MIYQKETFEILHQGSYKGYNFYIISFGCYPCAYVEIPENSKFYGLDYYDIDIDVHGGLTYSTDHLNRVKENSWFIGWDYAHIDDYTYFDIGWAVLKDSGKMWTTKEIFENVKDVIDQLILKGGETDEQK